MKAYEFDMYECPECLTVFGVSVIGLEVLKVRCPNKDCRTDEKPKVIDSMIVNF